MDSPREFHSRNSAGSDQDDNPSEPQTPTNVLLRSEGRAQEIPQSVSSPDRESDAVPTSLDCPTQVSHQEQNLVS